MAAGRINVYTCTICGAKTITIDRDDGVTPFMINCSRCDKGPAQSHFYRAPQDLTPTHEFYKPDDAELGTLMSFEAGQMVYHDHVEKGGLLYRKIGGRTFTEYLMEKEGIRNPDSATTCTGCESSCQDAKQTQSSDETTYETITEQYDWPGPCLIVEGCSKCDHWHVLLCENGFDKGSYNTIEDSDDIYDAVHEANWWSTILKIPAFIEAGREDLARDSFVKVVKDPVVLDGVGEVWSERIRQVDAGDDATSDDQFQDHELARAAKAWIFYNGGATGIGDHMPEGWKDERAQDKHGNLTRCDRQPSAQRIRDLAKAGALCAAEIDRLRRKDERDNAHG